MSTVGILNVGAGDTKLVFDPNNPQDMIRAARVVKDMLRRGYALLVDTGQRAGDGKPIFTRAYDFDEAKCEYIIADFDPLAGQPEESNEPATEPSAPPSVGATIEKAPRLRSQRGHKRLSASTANAVAVPRTAGG